MLLTISDITNLESFCNSNNVISLNCIILGDNFDDIFTLEISCICLDNGIFLLEINIVKLATPNKWRMYSHRRAMAEIYNKEVRGGGERLYKKCLQISAVHNYHVLGLLGSSLDVLLSAIKGDEIRGANGIYNKESRTISGKYNAIQPNEGKSSIEHQRTIVSSAKSRIATLIKYEVLDSDPRELIYYINCVAEFGFNHIIIVGETEYGMIFIDCYGRVFMWDDESPMLWPLGNSPEEIYTLKREKEVKTSAQIIKYLQYQMRFSYILYIYNLSFLSQGRWHKKFGAKFIYYGWHNKIFDIASSINFAFSFLSSAFSPSRSAMRCSNNSSFDDMINNIFIEDIKYSKVRPLRSYASSG
ncbi:unnamed protein product [Rhizophagus irregularis]|nr:unnamed protein product [Rhizophagus irregularis]